MKRLILILAFVCIIIPLVNLLNADIMMWEVENGRNKAYLLGSVHLMPEDAYPLAEQIETAFESSDRLVVEFDPANIDQNEMQSLIVNSGLYPEGTTLQSQLPADLYTEVTTKLQELGLVEAQYSKFKPWFVAINLGLGALQKIDIKAGTGIDLHFLTKARERQMTILDLETPTAQMEALSSMQDSTQIDYLQYMMEDYDQIEENFTKMLDAWQIGDADKMNKLYRVKLREMEDELPGIKEYYQKLLPDRDKKMVEQIKLLLENEEDHTYFIIVGAFHLVGSDGMLQLLEDNGYVTKQY